MKRLQRKRRRIAIVTFSEIRRDPRVRRIAGSFARAGDRVTVFTLKSECAVSRESLDGFEVVRVNTTRFWPPTVCRKHFQKLCGPFFEQMRSQWPDIFLPLSFRKSLVRLNLQWAGDILTYLPALLPLAKRAYGALRSLKQRLQASKACQDMEVTENSTNAYAGEVLETALMLELNVALYEAVTSIAPELVYCNDLATLFVGAIAQRQMGSKLFYDAHEIYVHQWADGFRSCHWKNFYEFFERELLKQTDARFTVCEALSNYFASTYKAAPFHVTLNCPSISMLPSPDVLDRVNRPRVILYQGIYVPHRGLEECLHAARYVDNARFVFRGIGIHESRLRALAADLGLRGEVSFSKPVPIEDMVSAASHCDIGLNPFIPVCKNTELCLPNKFFEYMMAGLCLASSDLVEIASLTRQLDIGVLFDSQRLDSIVETLNELIAQQDYIDDCRRRSYEAARMRYNWEEEERRFQAHVSDVLS